MTTGGQMVSILELDIVRAGVPDQYQARVIESPAGNASATLQLDASSLRRRLPELQQTLLASSVPSRRVVSRSEATVREIGRQLFEALFSSEALGNIYRASIAVAAERGDELRVILRLDDPDLMALPWEGMYDGATDSYVSRREPLLRYLPVPTRPPPLKVQLPLRILALTASPRGLALLDIQKEREDLDRALESPVQKGLFDVHWIENATWQAVQEALLNGEWHVVHFIGHGYYDTDHDEGVLAFVNDEGRAHRVRTEALVDLFLEAKPMPRLVVLNACETSATGSTDMFAAVASSLVRAGVHAVAAMQFEISDKAAIAFCSGFYSAISAGRGVGAAVRSGRIAILGLGDSLEWMTPTLTVRGRETRLFDVDRESSDLSSGEDGSSHGPELALAHGRTVDKEQVAEGEVPSGDQVPRRPSIRRWWHDQTSTFRHAAVIVAALVVVGTGALALERVLISVPSTPWEDLPDLPVALEGAAAASYQGRIWVAGGVAADGDRSLLDSVHIFDPEFGTWSAGPPLPKALAFTALVNADNRLLVLGGQKSDGAVASVYRLQDGAWIEEAPLPAERLAGAAVWDGSRVVYAGGVGRDHAAADEIFALQEGAWQEIGLLQVAREKTSAASDGFGTAWMLGGRDTESGNPAFGAVDVIKVNRISGSAPISPVHSSAATWIDGYGPCILGGDTGTGVTNETQCPQSTTDVPVLPSARAGLAVATLDESVYVVGGYNDVRHGSTTFQVLRLDS